MIGVYVGVNFFEDFVYIVVSGVLTERILTEVLVKCITNLLVYVMEEVIRLEGSLYCGIINFLIEKGSRPIEFIQ